MRATMTKGKSNQARPIARRTLVVGAAASGAILVTRFPTPAIAQQKTVKIGYVSPQTGPLAAFAEARSMPFCIWSPAWARNPE
jgi:hypothetical protein